MSSNRLKLSPSLQERTGRISNLSELYRYAKRRNYDTYAYDFGPEGIESLSVMQVADGKCYIAINPSRLLSAADELCKGLHEVGHCDRGAFYNEYAVCDVRQKQENKADKRAIELRLSADDLDQAVADGYTDIWSLSEYFGVTEEFMRKAVCWYTFGNLAAELYF